MTVDDLTLATPGADVRLTLLRHAETPSNVGHVLDTVPPGPGLTDKGRQQARELAERFATEKVHAVHASRALRTQETARPLADRHDLDVAVIDGVHEIFVGDLEGTSDLPSKHVFDRIYARWLAGELDVPMPGGETAMAALSRFVSAAHQTLDGVPSGMVIMVSHGALLRLAGTHLSSNLPGGEATVRHLHNTGAIVLEPAPATATGWRCVQWDGLDLG